MALFSTAYYGFFRIGELTKSIHAVKVKDIHIGLSKRKVLFMLQTSKTHGKGDFPQSIKIAALKKRLDP